ncbi:related to pseudouridine synthase 3 [Lecanosticta acicola]|uniref:Related to pseudouridine synthase 3 n=1 Tax=Lecanosticta acicola TaxID=111012 RepID=A0AAI8YR32_9PEZI|nr:related to pseudouridine synthase 3 [Lecanosticta acicola]
MDHHPPPSEDYTTWTTTALIHRVTALETQLRAQQQQQDATHKALNKKPPQKKKPKTFDPDKYHTRLIALKFAYLGGKYNGFEHHNKNFTPLPTIEEELYRALKKTKLIFPRHRDGQSEEEVCWEGCEYSKCGRTDRGVSAFGQVIGVRVRSARPKVVVDDEQEELPDAEEEEEEEGEAERTGEKKQKTFDSVRDELPYIQLINRVLPPDIRILAWCPHPPRDFSARFNCKERRYRYFFTNPAYIPLPGGSAAGAGEGWLDVEAMSQAAKKYEGLHDFRNFCKIDGSKQISDFSRRIFHAGIYQVPSGRDQSNGKEHSLSPRLFYFEVRGSAFLWHQVRHLVAILFLVGQGYEKPSIVDELLDIQKTPARPLYEMASDIPLVLWECLFPDPEKVAIADHVNGDSGSFAGYEDALDWVYVGDERGGRDQSKRATTAVEDGKHGRNGIMEELWALWRKRKMDEALAWNLMEVVAAQGRQLRIDPSELPSKSESARLFDGSERPRTVGPYVPVMQRERMETPDVVNARYAARKGLNWTAKSADNIDIDE